MEEKVEAEIAAEPEMGTAEIMIQIPVDMGEMVLFMAIVVLQNRCCMEVVAVLDKRILAAVL